MQTLSGALSNLFPVLCYDVNKGTAYDPETGDKEVYVLSRGLVEELIMDVQDGFISIL